MQKGMMTFLEGGGSIDVNATIFTNKVVSRMAGGGTTNRYDWFVAPPGG
jgi:hypothetical protein